MGPSLSAWKSRSLEELGFWLAYAGGMDAIDEALWEMETAIAAEPGRYHRQASRGYLEVVLYVKPSRRATWDPSEEKLTLEVVNGTTVADLRRFCTNLGVEMRATTWHRFGPGSKWGRVSDAYRVKDSDVFMF